jgi:hypothetical protein
MLRGQGSILSKKKQGSHMGTILLSGGPILAGTNDSIV